MRFPWRITSCWHTFMGDWEIKQCQDFYPFGSVSIIPVGDLYQLSPVKGKTLHSEHVVNFEVDNFLVDETWIWQGSYWNGKINLLPTNSCVKLCRNLELNRSQNWWTADRTWEWNRSQNLRKDCSKMSWTPTNCDVSSVVKCSGLHGWRYFVSSK